MPKENNNITNLSRYRRWMLTWNNWQEHFRTNASCETIIKKINEQSGLLHQYIVVGKEKAPKTGQVHLQIYVEYVNQATFQQMKDRYPGAHIEVAFSPGYQCSMYCKKENDFYEEGEYRQRKLSIEDIASNVIMLLDTHRPAIIAEKFPEYASYIVRNFKSLSEIYMDKQQNGNFEKGKEPPY
jgi:hypothetical protein